MDQHPLWTNKPDCGSSGASVDSGVLLDCRAEGAGLCGKQNTGRTRSCSNDCLNLGNWRKCAGQLKQERDREEG